TCTLPALRPGSWASAGIASAAHANIHLGMDMIPTVLRSALVREHGAVRLVVAAHAIDHWEENPGRAEDGVDGDVHHVIAETTAIRPAAGHDGVGAVGQHVAAEHAEPAE